MIKIAALLVALAACSIVPADPAPRTPIGYPVDATPMSGVCTATRCLGNHVQCLGQDGQWHNVATCAHTCVNNACT